MHQKSWTRKDSVRSCHTLYNPSRLHRPRTAHYIVVAERFLLRLAEQLSIRLLTRHIRGDCIQHVLAVLIHASEPAPMIDRPFFFLLFLLRQRHAPRHAIVPRVGPHRRHRVVTILRPFVVLLVVGFVDIPVGKPFLAQLLREVVLVDGVHLRGGLGRVLGEATDFFGAFFEIGFDLLAVEAFLVVPGEFGLPEDEGRLVAAAVHGGLAGNAELEFFVPVLVREVEGLTAFEDKLVESRHSVLVG
mmetsp:Transcript_13584/g.36184  ORF Transcript_13584/g.36184 Transcript_13584/m.36184 type:complete len:245 (+) Transcript_13584:633-1367(+)